MAGALFGCLTGCQSQDPNRQGLRAIQVGNLQTYVEGIARRRERDQRSKVGSADLRTEETVFEQNLGLSLDGYAYHPNFMEFSLGGLFGLMQHDFDSSFATTDRSSSDDGNVVEFDFSGNFLKKKKYPGTAFARRYRALEPRPFRSSMETTTNNFGLGWRYVSEKAPTSLLFNHTDIELDPLDDTEANGRQRNTTFRFQTGYKFTATNVFSLVYDRRSVEEEPFDFQYDYDEVTLSHQLQFGDTHQHSLDSSLNFFDQRGTFNVERARWLEVLRLQHTDALRSIYQLEITDRTQGTLAGVRPIEELSYYGSVMVEHKLYSSLTTNLLGFAQNQEFGSGAEVDRYGSRLSANYRKGNAWGVLLADYVAQIQREDRQGRSQNVQVVDESQSFNDPSPAVLGGTGIRAGSIRITNLDRTILYQRGTDYTVETFENRVEIRRVPTGRIADGQTVLFNYEFNLGGDFTLDTANQSFGIRQNFKFGLSPYYRLRWQDQTLSSDTVVGALAEDITAHIFGAEFRWKGFRLMTEYEEHQSNINPFDALRMSAGYNHRFRSGASASVRTRRTEISRSRPNSRETVFVSVEGRYRHPITRRLTVEGAILYRTEEDSVGGDDEGLDLDLSLEWFIRRTEIRVTFEQGRFEDSFAESDHSALYLQVRRGF